MDIKAIDTSRIKKTITYFAILYAHEEGYLPHLTDN